jgi:hypothetical protein
MGEAVRVTGTRRKRAQTAGKGGVGSGLLFLIGGLLLRGHFQPLKQACASGAGQFSQALSTSAQQQCGTDSFLAELGTILIVFGGVLLALALLGVVILLLEARSPAAAPARPRTGVSGSSSTATGSGGRLHVRCPRCNAPNDVTSTDAPCFACGVLLASGSNRT